MDNFKDIAEKRRSVNYFDKSKNIPDKLIKDIVNLATLSPSAFNFQPWKLLIFRSKESKEKLFNEICKQKKVKEAPITIAILGDKNGYKSENPIWQEKLENGLTEEKKEKIIKHCDNSLYDNEVKKHGFAVRNSSLFAMSLMYSAKYYDVDSHPMIGFNEEKLKEVFNLPENIVVTMLISFGYKDMSVEMKPREKRFNYEDIVNEI